VTLREQEARQVIVQHIECELRCAGRGPGWRRNLLRRPRRGRAWRRRTRSR
jgi:hypothetical protein